MPIVSFEQLVGCCAVEATGPDTFAGPHLEMPYYRIFGGQLLAQFIAVATADAGGKHVKSLHTVFPREGDLSKPLLYRVTRPHDGRGFATRQLVAEQEGRVIGVATASLHVLEDGPTHQLPRPQVPGPDALPSVDLSMIPLDTRVVGGVDLSEREPGPASLEFWMRAPADPGPASVHQAVFAHCTDLTLIGTALRPLPDLSQADSPERIHTAVTSHTLWFHAPVRIDGWLLLAQHSPRLGGARAFGTGHAFDGEGQLVASYAQEAMIRPVSA